MSFLHSRIALSLSLTAALLLAACGGGSAPAPAASTETAALAPPATPALEKLYNQTCHNCHTIPASGSPQAGDKIAWAPRLAQGRDALLDHTINGFRGMPPMGTCTQCTEEDFVGLIEYMAGSKLK